MSDSGKDLPGSDLPSGAPTFGDPFGDGTFDAPNCPKCLHQMQPASTARGGVFWECADCGQTSIA